MTLSRKQYGVQVAGFAAQVAVQIEVLRTAEDDEFVFDAAQRAPLVAACEELRAIISQARVLQPPWGFEHTHATFCVALVLSDQAAECRLAGAALMDRGELQEGIRLWGQAASVETDATAMIHDAVRQLQA